MCAAPWRCRDASNDAAQRRGAPFLTRQHLANKALLVRTRCVRRAQVRVGVCAMDRKANSKPMREITARLMSYGDFEVVSFGDEVRQRAACGVRRLVCGAWCVGAWCLAQRGA
jgi:hypothetical protein